MPIISAAFVDGSELAKRNKDNERAIAVETRTKNSISALNVKKALLLKSIATLEHSKRSRHRSLAGDLG